MKGSYIKKISILLTIIFLSSYVIASSFVQLDTKELKGYIKEVKALKLYDDIKYMKQTDINNLKELIWN